MEFLFHYYLIHAYFKKSSSITAKKMIGEHNNVTLLKLIYLAIYSK